MNKLIKTLKGHFAKHLHEYLAGLGIGLMGVSTVSAVLATPKAIKLIDDKKKDLNTDKLTAKETVKTCWKEYAIPAVSFATGAACVVGSVTKSNKNYIALSGSYEFLKESVRIYKENVIETIGEKKEKQVRDKIAQKEVDAQPIDPKTLIIVDEKDDTYFFEPLTGTYFKSNLNKVKRLALEASNQEQESSEGYLGVIDWVFMYLGLSDEMSKERSDAIFNQWSDKGWSIVDQGGCVIMDFHPVIDSVHNQPVIVISYSKDPISDYNIYYK